MRNISAIVLISLIGALGVGVLRLHGSADDLLAAEESSPATDDGWKEEVATATKDKAQKDEQAKEALQKLRAAEKTATRPRIDQPRLTPAQEKEGQRQLEEARQRATEATLAQVEARKRLQRLAEQRPQPDRPASPGRAAPEGSATGTPGSSAGLTPTNPLRRLDPKLERIYEQAEQYEIVVRGSDIALRNARGLPESVLLQARTGPLEKASQKYQDQADSDRKAARAATARQQKIPPVGPSGPVQARQAQTIIGRWRRVGFNSGLTFEPGGRFSSDSGKIVGTWSQSGTNHFTAIARSYLRGELLCTHTYNLTLLPDGQVSCNSRSDCKYIGSSSHTSVFQKQ